MIGLTVVGKPAATVMTSSPGRKQRSPSDGDVKHESAARLAEDPELTSDAQRTPMKAAKSRSNSAAKRPVVNQASSEASTRVSTSDESTTLPETGTALSPGLNGCGVSAASEYSLTRAAISRRSCWGVLNINPSSPGRMRHRSGNIQELAVPRDGAI